MKRTFFIDPARRLANLSACAAVSAAPLLLACSSGGDGGSGPNGGSVNANGGATSGQGGSTASGGTSSTSGGNSSASGGKSASGGTSSTSGGNSSASGGSPASGGLVGSGGASKGGASASGGASAQGGSAAKGGSSNANGGSSAKGGGSGTAGSAGATSGDKCSTDNEEKFSFFLLSNAALIRESGKPDGFGGGLGGLEGADKICQHVAEFVSPCQKNKVWHAFLSTSTVNAIDRIGSGPWYDRNGRLVSKNLTDLVQDRPGGADAAIKNDLPNENGVPNHNPDGTGQVDNHEVLTGSGTDGKLYVPPASGGGLGDSCAADVGGTGMVTWSAERGTCWGWTRATEEGCPRAGHSWPRKLSGTNWISVWNEAGCAPGGTLADTGANDGTRRVGAGGGYGGYYCFAVIPHP